VAQAGGADNGRVTVRTTEPTAALYELTAWARGRATELEALTVTPASLEDVYLGLAEGEEEGG
jgi:hypothetical protein